MPTPPEPSDYASDLAHLHALQAGDDSVLNLLISKWEKPLFGFAWRYVRNTTDARDLVAETFVKLYQHRARLAADSNVSAWLFTTLQNLCHKCHRWRERHPAQNLDDLPVTGSLTSPATQRAHLEKQEINEALGEAINRLPHDLKVTLLLHHYEQLSYREIGEVTGCSERGVETRLYRARQRLRGELSAYEVDIAQT